MPKKKAKKKGGSSECESLSRYQKGVYERRIAEGKSHPLAMHIAHGASKTAPKKKKGRKR